MNRRGSAYVYKAEEKQEMTDRQKRTFSRTFSKEEGDTTEKQTRKTSV